MEIGASAGLNLIPDRYCYLVGSEVLGDASSPVRFLDPWQPGPAIDLLAAAGELELTARAGCDANPLHAGDPEDRITLLSYIWPDELDRIDRLRAALETASESAHRVDRASAHEWLNEALQSRPVDELTVVWHSIFRQYVEATEWAAIESSVRRALSADPRRPAVWLGMEPGDDPLKRVAVTVLVAADEDERVLASCGDHGPPVRWRDQVF
jgi:hypothetical protein